MRQGAADAVEVTHHYDPATKQLRIVVRNHGPGALTVRSAEAYAGGAPRTHALAAGATLTDAWPIAGSDHWYDVSVTLDEDPRFLRRLAGHIETGRPSRSDPALERPLA